MRTALVLTALGVLSACRTPAPFPLGCQFVPVQGPDDEIARCASVGADGALAFAPEMLDAVRRKGSDLVEVSVRDTLRYVTPNGRSAPVLVYDNGADPFAEGLARTVRQGKVGFVDRALAVRIAPAWDFAFPFENGRAQVCQGCRPQQDGEHRSVVGGLWGTIDTTGTEIVPVRFAYDALPPLPQ